MIKTSSTDGKSKFYVFLSFMMIFSVLFVCYSYNINTTVRYATNTATDLLSKIQSTSTNIASTTTTIASTTTTTTEKLDTSPIYMLFWVAPFGSLHNYYINKELCGDCIVSYDQKDLDRAEAVIIHFSEATLQGIPDKSRRKSNQMYTFFVMESPWAVSVMRGMSFKVFDNYFNWTMSYRRDSSIHFPYIEWFPEGSLFNGNTAAQYSEQVVKDILDKKKDEILALWMVGNCGYTQGAKLRRTLVSELETAGLTIDKMGACFGKPAPRNDPSFAQKYKFYLAFENAVHCRDYITEKFWSSSLSFGLVPIVWGPKREDVVAVAPKGSFIFYEDYSSTAELVKYLQYLNTNNTAYAEYFNWRIKQPTPVENPLVDHIDYEGDRGLCKMCRLLWQKRSNKTFTSIVPSLENWWKNSDRPECLSKTTTLHDKYD
uniref:Fucosyltransferase n=1 Tax=Ciona savignyi TaxID=51511 RepID=H2ZQB6_CIOSA